MEHRQVDGIDAYNSPPDIGDNPLLGWMGDDYVKYIALTLLDRFHDQDAEAEMLGIKLENEPSLETVTREADNVVCQVGAGFELQVLLRSSSGEDWRLKGIATFVARELEQRNSTTVEVTFSIEHSEQI